MNRNINEIPQNWNFYMCRIENKPGSIRLNLALYDIAPLENYHQRIQLSVKMQKPTPEGLSSNEEFETLNRIEDLLHKRTVSFGAVTAGVVKTDGILEIHIYTQDTESIEKACADMFKNYFSSYEWKIQIYADDKWDLYFNFLYPDKYTFQAMQNRKVIYQLEQQGDNLEKARNIDHWLYFSTVGNITSFTDKVKELGFTILSSEKIENSDYPYQINISREDVPNNINNITWELMDMADSSGGYYDGWGCVMVKE